MYGPEKLGHWSISEAVNSGRDYQFLTAGRSFVVVKPFRDFDGDLHETGEKWAFLGYSFLPYEDGLSWFVSLDGTNEWHIRLKLTDDEQGEVINSLYDYIEEEREKN